MTTTVYFHDYTEVDPAISWTGLCPPLEGAQYVDIRHCEVPAVQSLFDYARPDVVIGINDFPVLSLEQTRMNPSGHNIPQRFSSSVRAAELGVPSIMYYPAFARRTVSDPNPRYINIRVPLTQFRMTEIYQVPCLSVFWPTDPATMLPVAGQAPQIQMAQTASALIENAGRRARLLRLPEVEEALKDMEAVAHEYGVPSRYRQNPSVRAHLPNGVRQCQVTALTIDPPTKAEMVTTVEFLDRMYQRFPSALEPGWGDAEDLLRERPFTLVWTGTANRQRTDSEHPWPGYLTLLDVLYSREDRALFTHMRDINLIYDLDIADRPFIDRLNRTRPPTAAFIVDQFADALVLDGALVVGRPIRGARPAQRDRW